MPDNLAFSASIVLILVYLPGRLPYYTAAVAIVAKLYSNSMVAMLNSRIKPVSNAPALSEPLWNESVKPIKLLSSTERAHNLSFRRDSNRDICSPCSLGIATMEGRPTLSID